MPRLDTPDRQIAQEFLRQDLPEGHPLAPLHAKLRESQTYPNAMNRRFVVMGIYEAIRRAISDRVYAGKPLTADHLITMSPLVQAASSLAVDRKELAAARRGFQRMVARMMPDKRKRHRFLGEFRKSVTGDSSV